MTRIGMFYYSDPDLTPLVTNPARMLAQAGYQVDVIAYYRCGNDGANEYGPGIRIIRLNQPGMDFPRGGVQKMKGLYDFVHRSMQMARRERYDLLYGHDMHGFLAAHRAGRALHIPVIYHCHDLGQLHGAGRLDRWIKRYEMRYSREAVAVILPEARRAAVMKKESGLQEEPFIVWNCPLKERKTHTEDPSRLPDHEENRWKRYVIRHGNLWNGGRGHCIEETIRSIPEWPEDAGFVLVGPIAHDYGQALRSLAQRLEVQDRLRLLPPMKYSDLFDVIGGASLGHALYRHPTDINKGYQSTASLKFFEYMRAGIPILAADEAGFKELIGEFQCGVCVDPTDSVAIGRAVRGLLLNEGLRLRLGENGYQAYQEKCHYEIQYRPVLDFLQRLFS